jgi:hypothetical protein
MTRQDKIARFLGVLIAVAGLCLAAALQQGAGLPRDARMIYHPLLCALAATWMCVILGGGVERLTGGKIGISRRFLSGLCLLSIWPIVLHHAGLFQERWLMAPLVAGPVVGVALLLRRSRAVAGDATNAGDAARPELEGLLDAAPAFLTGVALLWGALSVAAPPTGMDTLTYHLGLPSQYLVRGSISPPDSLGYYFYWQLYEMAVLPLVAADPSGIAANLFGWPIFAALVVGCRQLGRLLGGSRAGWLAAAAAATSPVILIVLTETKNDILAAALVVSGVTAWLEHDRPGSILVRRVALGAFFLGGALAVKPTTAFVVAPLLLLEAWRARAQVFRLAALAPILLLPSYWAIRNLIMVGHPLAPNIVASVPLAGGLFDGIPGRLAHLASSFFVFIPFNIDGPLGPALLVLSVAAAFGLADLRPGLADRRSRTEPERPPSPATGHCASPRAEIAGVAIAALLFWVLAGRGQARFLLPAILLAASSGAAWIAASGRKTAGALLVAVAVTMGTSVRLIEAHTGFLMLQSGVMSSDRFVDRWVNTWRIQKAANQALPRDVDIISIGGGRHFPLKRRVISDGYWERSRVLEHAHDHNHDPGELHGWLREKGFEYVMNNPASLNVTISMGEVAPPRCPLDTETLDVMLQSDSYCRPVLVDPRDSQLTIHELR